MSSAPAVSYPVGRSRFHGRLLAGVLVIGASSLTAWVMQADVVEFRHIGAALLWLISAGVAGWVWRHTPEGLLTWDGERWTWTRDKITCVVSPRVSLDLQHTMLLHLQATGASGQWVWLEQRTAPLRWLPCRRAVFAPQAADKSREAGWIAP